MSSLMTSTINNIFKTRQDHRSASAVHGGHDSEQRDKEAHAIGNEHGGVVSCLDREVNGPSVRMFQIPQGRTLL